MKPILLFYISFLCIGIMLLVFAFLGKNKLQHQKDLLTGIHPKEKTKEEQKNKKNKQQAEMELLLINSSSLLKKLGDLDKNIVLKLLITSSIFGVYYFLQQGGESTDLFMVFAGIFIVVILIPNIVSGVILKKKIKLIMVDLPNFIDLVAVCVQTGMTIDMALKQVAKDFKRLNPDLAYVMLRIIRKAEITSLSAALDELAISLPTREIRMFTTVLQQSLNFGSSIYGQLIQLSTDIRELQLLAIEERLGTLSAKMSIPLIAFIMFPIVILILAPGAMRVLANVF
ncbi:type II secretion system F family protein [Phocoenobacter skyensis]|uniref:Tight adherence protein C n=1 Tax=Phocoenobacter skyensis TaxID=97481 RepID=A0A1H7X5T6_9PAST|nr:type II secretion system F family protein [Pasteurella skyensis]MDP8079603.1 type II secretion system F family protein [Pasteurella skyensis]MDP8085552.1 type II secretion system F family protein [Pasteurella skyensis]MDP8185606.1 type II secretion system F family protein [Pasteurella skyensis]QLB21923.1 pilus assembly protein TadC [Pasteurella skyensis]SEM28975.1 tight adherence protein C [Pasteurella skyensis]